MRYISCFLCIAVLLLKCECYEWLLGCSGLFILGVGNIILGKGIANIILRCCVLFPVSCYVVAKVLVFCNTLM